ncbi:HIT domain-containing protein [Candidatus Woesearchaeota archaeon]|nr:HIT domain-containing protein [Candidatus Woesearchaeota archaeon]
MDEKKEACPFCEIVGGKIQTRRVYEDDHVLVILDINPASPGHLLLMPKKHFRTLTELPIALTTYLATICKQLSWAVLRTLQAQGTTIILAQGEAAGQHVPHLLFHIIPRKEQDGLMPINIPQQPFTAQDLNDVKAMIIHGIKHIIEGMPKGENA